MGIKDYLPMDQEIEDIQITRDLASSLDKLQSLEDNVMKGIKDLADRMKKANSELEKYLGIQNEASRLYIQLVNRKSDLIKQPDLTKLKAHVANITQKVNANTNLYHGFLELASGYKEYQKTLGNLSKATGKLNKHQKDWHDSAADLAKAQSSQAVSGGKLDKIENSIEKNKRKVMKAYEDRKHQEAFVETAHKRVNQLWLKLKDIVKNTSW
jgi:chromosome segregation ATPase